MRPAKLLVLASVSCRRADQAGQGSSKQAKSQKPDPHHASRPSQIRDRRDPAHPGFCASRGRAALTLVRDSVKLGGRETRSHRHDRKTRHLEASARRQATPLHDERCPFPGPRFFQRAYSMGRSRHFLVLGARQPSYRRPRCSGRRGSPLSHYCRSGHLETDRLSYFVVLISTGGAVCSAAIDAVMELTWCRCS